MSNVEQQYLDLVKDILENGYTKGDRTGTGTKSVFGRTIRHSMKDGFPLLTTKKMAFKTMVTELLWFLRGDTNIKYLVDNDCNIWVGDAYKNYEKHCQSLGITEYDDKETFIKGIKELKTYADKFGELGPVYGMQWRRWKNFIPYQKIGTYENGSGIYNYRETSIDQIANAIHLLKTDPDSRRILVSAWNVGELDQMVLPPCHYSFQFYTRELSLDERAKQHPNPNMFYDIHGSFNIGDSIENSDMTIEDREWLHGKFDEGNIPKRAISLLWNQRSCDAPLGLPINIPSYSLLLMMVAKQVNMVPEEVIANMGDCHIYLNQIEGIEQQLTRIPYDLPTLKISDRVVNDISEYTLEDFTLENYKYHPAIKLPLSN
jgi:thymidylate synthase